MVIAGTIIVVAVLTLDVYAHVGGLDPLATTYQYLSPPNLAHVMGTDQLGRDLLARVSIGTTFSLLVAFISVIISVGVGCIIGAISGFFGGKTDRAISLAFDALYALPPLIIAILIAAMIGAGIVNTGIAIAVGYMPQYFRIVRGIILSIKERPFIESTRAIGAGYVSLIFRHMMPYAIPSIIALMTLNMGSGIVDVSGLGFLGLGLPPPTPEWGTDLGLRKRLHNFGRMVAFNFSWIDDRNQCARVHSCRRRPRRNFQSNLDSTEGEILMAESLLDVKDLRAYYYLPSFTVKAIDGISFGISEAEALGIIGESGSGKSTIGWAVLRALPNPGKIVSGEISLGGRNLLELDREEMRKIRWKEIAMVTQSAMSSFDPLMRIGDQIAEAVTVHEDIPQEHAIERAKGLFEEVSLEPRDSKVIHMN